VYRKKVSRQLEFVDFYLPFSGKLSAENRWVKLAEIIPWELAEEIYAEAFCDDFGAPALSARVALGALLIKEREGLTDRGTVETIQENPYMQFFIGLEEFTEEPPFDASLMVDFRKRFGEAGLARISEAVALAQVEAKPNEQASNEKKPDDRSSDNDSSRGTSTDNDSSTSGSSTAESNSEATKENTATSSDDNASSANTNHGQLIMDATCAPADIRYPTDVSLLNEAREKTDEIIDVLHGPLVGKSPRPRTYRKRAARDFKAFILRKKPRRNVIRKAIRKQLGYLRRNLNHIEKLLQNRDAASLRELSKRQYKTLLVCHEVCRQQQQMYDTKSHRVDDRIVSLSQPHVRPIKRGKAGRDTEFGAKLSVSVVDGFSFLDHLRWNSFNESCDFIGQVEAYRRRFGFYPESVHVDQIYRTRANRAFCKANDIRMSGPPLGRRPKDVTAATKQQARADESIRSTIEGKFGQAKRRFGLSRVMAKLEGTSAAQISLSFLVLNLEAALRRLLFALLVFLTRQPRLVSTHHSPLSH
jgi:IS5 family transposase